MTKQITPLRQRMIDDMALRNMSPATQRVYINAVKNFSAFFGRSPDKLTFEDVRTYQLHLVSRGPRYTTLLRAVELWGAVQADGPGRLAGDEEPPAVDGFVVGREENFSQQIKANPEDRLSTAFVGLEEDGPVFRLPFTGRVGERKGHGQHSEKLADPVGVNHVGILEIEAPRLGGREERFDRPPPPVMGQGDLGIGVGGDYKQVSADQPRRSPFQGRSKRAVA